MQTARLKCTTLQESALKMANTTTAMAQKLNGRRRREISVWVEDSSTNEPQTIEPSTPVEQGRFRQAKEHWERYTEDEIESSVSTSNDLEHIGYPTLSYEVNGFRFVETTCGYTVRPALAHYLERKIFSYPYDRVSKDSLLTFRDMIERALKHVQRSIHYANECPSKAIVSNNSTAPSNSSSSSHVSKVIGEIPEPDLYIGIAKRKLFDHWNILCELLDKLEDEEGWQSVFEFCCQKAKFTLGRNLRVSADDALGAYTNLATNDRQPLTLYIAFMKADLMPPMEHDLVFVTKHIEAMVRHAPESDQHAILENAGPDNVTTELNEHCNNEQQSTSSSELAAPECPITEHSSAPTDEQEQFHSPEISPVSLVASSRALPSPLERTMPLRPSPRENLVRPSNFPEEPSQIPIRGRLTRSLWSSGSMTSVPRSEDEMDSPRYQSRFYEHLQAESLENGQPGSLDGRSSHRMSTISEDIREPNASAHAGEMQCYADETSKKAIAWAEKTNQMRSGKSNKVKQLMANLRKRTVKDEIPEHM